MEKSKAISRRQFLAGLGVTAGAIGLSTLSSCSTAKKHGAINLTHGNDSELFPVYKDGKYISKNFWGLTKNLNLGLTPENISNHIGLYKKYIEEVNWAEKRIALNIVKPYLVKNLAFALNGMALHDMYFSNMTTDSTKRSTALEMAIEGTYGSFETYFENLTDTAMSVKGWSITGLNLLNGKIFNYGEDHHSSNFPSYVMPILALDVYDHAWVKQFGNSDEAKREYINVFARIINWDLVSRRYDAITTLYS